MEKAYGKISDKALQDATGKNWDAWIARLDQAGAESLDHKAIARLIVAQGWLARDQGWWAQTVTVGYEYAKGRRVIGQTADAGFQVGVQKTLPVDAPTLWEFLLTDGLPLWLGDMAARPDWQKGARYQTTTGTRGEIRSLTPGEKLRLTWQPEGEAATTLQLYLLPNKTKTALRFHQEKLVDEAHRETMKQHWRQVLKVLLQSLENK